MKYLPLKDRLIPLLRPAQPRVKADPRFKCIARDCRATRDM